MKKVLIIDDEVGLCVLMSRILERKGYHTIIAHDGLEGLRLLEQQHVDLVLLDIMMPGMNGIEVCSQIRNYPTTAAIPVLLMTAYHSPDTYQKILETGADQILYKPFDTNKLLQMIGDLLNTPLAQPPVVVPQS
jgi:CheY-like chemotaxis protein